MYSNFYTIFNKKNFGLVKFFWKFTDWEIDSFAKNSKFGKMGEKGQSCSFEITLVFYWSITLKTKEFSWIHFHYYYLCIIQTILWFLTYFVSQLTEVAILIKLYQWRKCLNGVKMAYLGIHKFYLRDHIGACI